MATSLPQRSNFNIFNFFSNVTNHIPPVRDRWRNSDNRQTQQFTGIKCDSTTKNPSIVWITVCIIDYYIYKKTEQRWIAVKWLKMQVCFIGVIKGPLVTEAPSILALQSQVPELLHSRATLALDCPPAATPHRAHTARATAISANCLSCFLIITLLLQRVELAHQMFAQN